MPHIQMDTVLFVFFAIALIFLIARLATAPMQVMVKLLMNSMLSVVILCFISMIGVVDCNFGFARVVVDLCIVFSFGLMAWSSGMVNILTAG